MGCHNFAAIVYQDVVGDVLDVVLLYYRVVPSLEIAGFYPFPAILFAFLQPFVFLVIEGNVQYLELFLG